MKIYCSCCDKVQPVRIDNCRDAKTNEPFQDIVCAECDLVIAAGTDIVPPAQQQEPVAWVWKDGTVTTDPDRADGTWMPLYASPPASKPWVGLTQEDMYEIGEFKNTHGYVPTGFKRLAAAIEAKLREKNA